MKITSLLLILTLGMLGWSCVDLSDVEVKKDSIQEMSSSIQQWFCMPAPADGLQVVLDPVMIPEEPQFLVLQLPEDS